METSLAADDADRLSGRINLVSPDLSAVIHSRLWISEARIFIVYLSSILRQWRELKIKFRQPESEEKKTKQKRR